MSDSRSGLDRRRVTVYALIAGICAVAVFLVAGLLTFIFPREQEAKNPVLRLVEVKEETTDPAAWGINWAREYDDYKRTAEVTKTRFGGSGARAWGKEGATLWMRAALV